MPALTMANLSSVMFWVGSAILVFTFARYGKFYSRNIPQLALCLSFIGICLAQNLLNQARNLVQDQELLFILLLASMLLGYLMNALMAQLLLRIIGFHSRRARMAQHIFYLLPTVAFVLMLINTSHSWFITVTDYAASQVSYAPLSLVFGTLSGLVLTVSLIISLVYTLRHKARYITLRVNLVIMASLLVPSIASWAESVVQAYHPSYMGFVSSYLSWVPAVVICYVNFGYLHTARSMAIASTQEIYVVFDKRGHIVDLNPAGRLFLQGLFGGSLPTRQQLFQLVGAQPAVGEGQASSFEFEIGERGDRRYYQANSFSLSDTISQYCGDGYVINEVTEYRKKMEHLNTLAVEDALTGAKNRRYFFDYSDQLMQQGGTKPFLLTMLMMDLDHFKRFNDSYGHSVGDEILVAVCRICEENIRRDDVLFRYGGEEFAVLSVGTGRDEGQRMAQRIVEAVAGTPIQTSAGPLQVTISVGGCSFLVHQQDSIDRWIEASDQHLYKAKNGGRNRVEYHS